MHTGAEAHKSQNVTDKDEPGVRLEPKWLRIVYYTYNYSILY